MKKYLSFLLEKSFPDLSIKRIAYNFGLTGEIEFLGGAVYGSAYRIGDKVIKITADEEEYLNALKLRRKPITKYLINYYDARRVKNSPADQEYYYILLMDYVIPISSIKINPVPGQTVLESSIYNSAVYMYNNIDDKKNIDEILKSPEFEENIKEYSESYVMTTEMFIDKIKQIYNMHKEANKYNISMLDAHYNNIGMKDGHYVYFDIGCEYNGGYAKHLKDWDYEDII